MENKIEVEKPKVDKEECPECMQNAAVIVAHRNICPNIPGVNCDQLADDVIHKRMTHDDYFDKLTESADDDQREIIGHLRKLMVARVEEDVEE